LRKNKNRNRWRLKLANKKKKKMKNQIKLLVSVAATSIILLAGCAGRITPQTAASLTTLAVYEAGKDNGKLAADMRQIQPAACNVASNPDATIEDVANAIANAAGAKPDTKVIVNVILSILQTSTAPIGTNTVNQSPYIKAVICDGWAGGLALLPDETGIVGEVTRRNAPMKKLPARFVLVK
jgi:phosphoglycerol transferase MdoB-like AlkP superfamily enzyme